MRWTFIIAALLTVGSLAWGQQSRPSLADTLEFLHNAAADTVAMGAPNSYSFDSHGCDVTIHANGPMATTSHFSLRDVEPKYGLRGEHGVSLTNERPTVEIITFSISTTQLRKKIRVEFDSGDEGYDSSSDQLFFVDRALATKFAHAFSDAVVDCGGENSPY